MSIPAWINAVAEEGTINEILRHSLDLRQSLLRMGGSPGPVVEASAGRHNLVAELVRLNGLVREREVKWDVV